jgi:hypothetical protein
MSSTAMDTIFMSKASTFLPTYSGVRPIISPPTNTATRAKTSMPVRPEPTPPNTTSPSWMSAIGTSPAQRGERVDHGVHRAAGRGGGHGVEQGRGSDAEARFLAFHIAAGLQRAVRLIDAERGHGGVALLFGCGQAGDGHGEDQHHGRQQGPALTGVAHGQAKGVDQCGGNQQHRDHLQEVAQRVRVFIRVGGIGVEEAAAIGAQSLIASCDATGPMGRICWLTVTVCCTSCPAASRTG